MAYWVRKITRSKWPDSIVTIDDMPADTISGELRTQKNTLSFWRIDSLDQLESAALALAISSKSSHIETIDMVYIPETEICEANLQVDVTPGDTIIPDLAELHRDLCSINYRTLGVVSSLINKNLQMEHSKRYTRKQVKTFLGQALHEQRISVENCNPEVYNEIVTSAG